MVDDHMSPDEIIVGADLINQAEMTINKDRIYFKKFNEAAHILWIDVVENDIKLNIRTDVDHDLKKGWKNLYLTINQRRLNQRI